MCVCVHVHLGTFSFSALVLRVKQLVFLETLFNGSTCLHYFLS